jgi:molybdopterin molybdotransferase
MRPAAPLGFGFVFGRPIFLLPGNPISCLCAYDVVVGRAVRRLGGRPADGAARREKLPLAESLPSLPGRLAYVRVQVTADRVYPLKAVAGSGAANISGACRADGYVLLAPHKPTYEPGEPVEVVFY